METLNLKKMQIDFFVSKGRTKEGVFIPTLCHGDTLVQMVDGTEDISACDALSTERRDFKLGITTADCACLCLSDGTTITAVHVGWRGLCLGLIQKALSMYNSSDVEIFVGPHLRTFEIQKDACYEQILDALGDEFFTYENGKILFQFKDAITSLLPEHAVFDERNTETDLTIPSNRRDGTTERLITVVSFIPLERT